MDECLSGGVMSYTWFKLYFETPSRVKRRYLDQTGQSGFDLAESVGGKKTRSPQLPKTVPFFD